MEGRYNQYPESQRSLVSHLEEAEETDNSEFWIQNSSQKEVRQYYS